MTLTVVGGFALLVEVLNIFAKDFFGGGRAQEKIRESIRKTQSELRAADKKLDSMRATRRAVVMELENAASKLEELERSLRRPSDAPPVLIHTVGSSGSGSGTRYRATITKTLTEDADENQILLWKQNALVEAAAASPDEAREATRRQFPESHGYAIGPFTAVGTPAVESAA